MATGLWDMAGVDGLSVAVSLFGEAVGHLAPFQSLETELQGEACSVLRLCDRNFRIVYPGSLDHRVAPLQADIWIKQHDWLSVVSLSPKQLPKLIEQATVRPPHRLENLPHHQAVPAQLAGIATLIWRHIQQGAPVVDLHVACAEVNRLIEKIVNLLAKAAQILVIVIGNVGCKIGIASVGLHERAINVITKVR